MYVRVCVNVCVCLYMCVCMCVCVCVTADWADKDCLENTFYVRFQCLDSITNWIEGQLQSKGYWIGENWRRGVCRIAGKSRCGSGLCSFVCRTVERQLPASGHGTEHRFLCGSVCSDASVHRQTSTAAWRSRWILYIKSGVSNSMLLSTKYPIWSSLVNINTIFC